jgi:UPF0176 protein
MSLVVATFYKFVRLNNLKHRQEHLVNVCQAQAVTGTIILAEEGINGTLAGTRLAIDAIRAELMSDLQLADLEIKESAVTTTPFERLKVKLKSEIVSFGVPEANPGDRVGTYVSPGEWNALIANPDVITIDTRNEYEVEIGTFEGAHNPQLQSFREFPDYVRSHLDPQQHKKVAMFCTGGIRCEKATSFLLQQGFTEVYHLKGGILKYLEEIPPEQSLWQGECFVFDQRVAVQHGIQPGSYDLCVGCGHPISEDDKQSPHYQVGVCCHRCYERLPERRQRRSLKRRHWRNSQTK